MSKESQLDALAALVNTFISGQIPTAAEWNNNPIRLATALGLVGDFFTDTDGAHADLVALFGADHDPVTGKNNTPAEWVIEAAAPEYVSSAQFRLAGDRRNDYARGHRLRATQGAGTVIVAISATVTYDTQTQKTTITVSPASLTSQLSQIERGLVRYSAPQVTPADLAADVAADIASRALRAGDTMEGPLLLAADPAAALEAVTKQYCDRKAPPGASYLVLGTNATLTAERVYTPRDALAWTDGGAKGAFTVDFNPIDPSVFFLRDDFCLGTDAAMAQANINSTLADLRWSAGTLNATNFGWTDIAEPSPRVGVRQFRSGGNGQAVLLLTRGPNNGTVGFIGFETPFEMVWIFKFVDAGAQQGVLGLFSDLLDTTWMHTSTAAQGVYLYANGTNFVYCCRNLTNTQQDTGPAFDNAWHKIKVRVISSSSVGFTFDALSEHVISGASVPTTRMLPGVQFWPASGGGNKDLHLDFFGLKARGLAR